jgi:hypothetical protein
MTIERETLSETYGKPWGDIVREPQILAKATGGELSYGVVLDSALCSAYEDIDPVAGLERSNKIYWAGTLLGKVTATGRYSYYDPSVSDGREDTDNLLVLKHDVNVQLGNRPAGAWKAFCCFNESKILYMPMKIALNSTQAAGIRSGVKTALQNCEFIVPTEISS